jgi:phosphoserine phosphatase RsbU/P
MQRTILIVDDQQSFTEIIRHVFHKQVQEGEYVLLFANSGQEALNIIEDNPHIHLVITDISMPGMDGLTFLERMNEENPYIKSIVISGYNEMSYIRRAMNAGASDYLIKPVSFDDLEESVSHTMNNVDIVREALRSRDRLLQLERDLVIAGEIQQTMLPQKFPAFPNHSEFDIFAAMIPAKEVGGDFYDFFLIDNEYIGFVIGDVTGKGIPAALLMALTRTLIRSYALQGKPANEVLTLVNTTLATDNRLAMFATTFFGVMEISTGVIEYCNAGHVPPYICRADGRVEQLTGRASMALGMLDNIPYFVCTTQLEGGDTLVLYTDGITDASNIKKEMFSMERIPVILSDVFGSSAQDILLHLISKVNTFVAGEEPIDDIGVLTLKYLGK